MKWKPQSGIASSVGNQWQARRSKGFTWKTASRDRLGRTFVLFTEMSFQASNLSQLILADVVRRGLPSHDYVWIYEYINILIISNILTVFLTKVCWNLGQIWLTQLYEFHLLAFSVSMLSSLCNTWYGLNFGSCKYSFFHESATSVNFILNLWATWVLSSVLGYLFPCSLGGVAIHSSPYEVLMVPCILYWSSRCIVLLNKHYYWI